MGNFLWLQNFQTILPMVVNRPAWVVKVLSPTAVPTSS